MTVRLEVTPNMWSTVMTHEGVYYAEVPYAEASTNLMIKSVKNLVNFTDTIMTGISAGSLTILSAKVLDGEFIFFAKIRPEDTVTLEVELEPRKSNILLA